MVEVKRSLRKYYLLLSIEVVILLFIFFYDVGSTRAKSLLVIKLISDAFDVILYASHLSAERIAVLGIVRETITQTLCAYFYMSGWPYTNWNNLFVPVAATSFYFHFFNFYYLVPRESVLIFTCLLLLDHFNVLRGADHVVYVNRQRIMKNIGMLGRPQVLLELVVIMVVTFGIHLGFVSAMTEVNMLHFFSRNVIKYSFYLKIIVYLLEMIAFLE